MNSTSHKHGDGVMDFRSDEVEGTMRKLRGRVLALLHPSVLGYWVLQILEL